MLSEFVRSLDRTTRDVESHLAYSVSPHRGYNPLRIVAGNIIGVIGTDPVSGWAVAGQNNATQNNTLVRKPNVTSGNTDWGTSAGTDATNSEWTVLSQDDFSNAGQHAVPEPSAMLFVAMVGLIVGTRRYVRRHHAGLAAVI